MFKIRVLSPFRHEFRTKDIWLASNEVYHLDPKADKDEIKYILSDLFPFRNFIYFNKQELSHEFLKETALERGFTPMGTPTSLLETEKSLEVPVDITAPFQEPAPNPFVDAVIPPPPSVPAELNAAMLPPQDLRIEATTDEGDAIAQVMEPQTKVDTTEREERKHALERMHWRKVKEIAETYEIDYTEKEVVINKIIEAEFN